MADSRRIVAGGVLVLGVILVFAGFSAAMGFTSGGILASAAAIVALLYAGATWSAGSRPQPVQVPQAALLVFDLDRRIVAGAGAGEALTSRFPEILRPEIERRCAAALAGTTTRFPCLHNGRMVLFDAVPVRAADGTIVYGILLSTQAEQAIGATA